MTHWADELAAHVQAGGRIERDEARRVLGAPDDEVPALLRATARVREHFVGRRVKLCQLRNARSGLCPEDCHYCSQSAISEADIPRYKLDTVEELLAGSRRAAGAGARRFCMVTSGRGPGARDIDRFCDAARRIKAEQPDLELCVSAGLMDEDQARALRTAGVDYVNHNLNTSARHHEAICTTHTYEDRVRTVEAVRRAGLRTCCGGILGMGESADDVVDLAFALRDLQVDSLPVNFLIPIDGTPFAGRRELSPTDCLRALCLFRLTSPGAEIRMAGGGESNLGWFRPLALHVVNSIFVDGYLTTPGQAFEEAQAMVAEMGYEVEV